MSCVFSRHSAQLREDGYRNLPDFAKYLPPPNGPSTGMASISLSLLFKTFDALLAAVYKTFLEEVALQDKQNRTLSGPNVNVTVEARDE